MTTSRTKEQNERLSELGRELGETMENEGFKNLDMIDLGVSMIALVVSMAPSQVDRERLVELAMTRVLLACEFVTKKKERAQ